MSKPIRILHVLGRTDRGGAESLVMNIYRNIDREKIQFDFAIHTDERCQFDDEIESLGGRIYHLPKYRIFNHFNYKASWKKLLKNNDFSAVHGHMDSTASIYLKIAKNFCIPTISHSHSISSSSGIKGLITNLYHKNINEVADYKFACSEQAGIWLYGNSTEYHIIKNGVDMEKFHFKKNVRDEVRRELNIQSNFVIGHVANYSFPKNHKFLIDIFKKVSELDSTAILILVGNKVKENLMNIVNNYHLESKVIFLGTRSDIDRLLQGFDVFVLPSIYEGLPVSLVEAQVSGLQCIVSDKVTDEAKITNNLEYLNIDKLDSSDCWTKEILKTKGKKRSNLAGILKDSEFNIRTTSDYLQEFYLSLPK